ncbi:non-ribosomal peptide synthetase [Pseudomonas vlassakiae]|uniref:non-ribosomal peptide synthetase n=1 Tax=Pseudomonas TaxID=286 RepID=UPI000C190019|nr:MULTISPECIES: non-ribosomal peptide synthetase [unclassified Pseudomonas]AXQ47327.1 non-ribosomal peptide synthetase [Stenotrophomonas rhizophila]MBS3183952.1 non-ribosomal peptide synthetase [Pseudomonas sp. PCH44]PIK76473.1 non-ribosomal peptide synthetase [Pseudomonas sp. 382]
MSTLDQSLKLARRFIELPLEKRRVFFAALRDEQVDFTSYPIPDCSGIAGRDQLSYAQQRMWFLWQLEPGSAAYNLPGAVRLLGRLDHQALDLAFADLVQRHECLRTTFEEVDGQVLQRVGDGAQVQVRHVDLSALDADQRLQRTREEVAREAGQPFDLRQGPLLRAALLQLAADEHVLLLTMHHIIADGWSMNILIDEFMRCLDARSAGNQAQLPALAVHYRDYALWQRSWMEAGEQARQLDYWRAQLGEEHEPLELPTDRPRPAQPSHAGARLEFAIDAELRSGLKALAQRQGTTLFVVLLAAFKTLLYRYSGQGDIRVGGLIANRNRGEVEGLIGFFVNTQVLRSQLDGQQTFEQLLTALRQTALGAQAHQELPFDALLEALQPNRSQSHNALFQVMYNHQPLVTDIQGMRLGCGLQLAHLDAEQSVAGARSHAAASDLMLETREEGERLLAAFTYATDLFDAATVERMAGHWRNLLRSVLANPQCRIGELELLDAAESRQLQAWALRAPAPQAAALAHQRFQAQAARTPEAVALVLAGEGQGASLSYAELERRSNRLAQCLVRAGVGPEVLVGVALERSLDMGVALLAVLKAGGAYVPLDPQAPGERIAQVFADSGLRLLLTQSTLLSQLPVAEGIEVLCLDQAQGEQPEHAPQVSLQPGNLAYVIYTSGSTGRPKGVAISHGALAEFCELASDYSRLSADDRVLQFATCSFDGFVEQFYPPLCVGAGVVLRDNHLWDSTRFLHALQQHGITVADLPAAYWHMLVQDYARDTPPAFAALRQVHVGGEAMAVDGLDLWRRAGLAGVRLLNTYGPTEATVVSSIHDCTALASRDVSWRGIPIGQGLAGRRLCILDGEMQPVPVGAIGELYIGGPGLARGYHGQPALSAERFLPDPDVPGTRLYRTGDRARFDANGAIEYIGRVDHQVKVRGFRIELGEIEMRLQQCPGVREAAVLALDMAGGRQLVAYAVTDADGSDAEAQRQAIRQGLRATLPDYMVPSHLVLLDRLPLTASGKLDRKALPVPDPSQLQAGFRAPVSEPQQRLAAIWMEVLQVPRVGLDDSFFDLGGHSLLAAQVIARIKSELGVALPMRSLFERPHLAALAEELETLGGSADEDWADMEAFMNSLEEV